MRPPFSFQRICYESATWCFLLLGALIVFVGSIGYDNLRGLADWIAPDGRAESLNPAVVTDMVPRLRLVGVAYLAIGTALIVSRRYLQSLFAQPRTTHNEKTHAEVADSGALSGTRDKWIWWVVLLTILTLGFALRAPYLENTMSHDGAFSYVNYSSFGPAVIATKYPNPNNHILHTHLTYVSQLITGGFAERTLRLPALAAGLGLIAVAGVFAKRLGGKTTGEAAGWLAAALIAASAIWIQYSTVSRGYTLLALLCILWIWITFQAVRTDSKNHWILFVAAGVLAYYTMPSVLFLHAGIVLYTLWVITPSRRLKALVANGLTGLGAVMVYLPTLTTMSLEEMKAAHNSATWERMEARPVTEAVQQNAQVAYDVGTVVLQDYASPVLISVIVGLVAFLWALLDGRHRQIGKFIGAVSAGVLMILLILRNVPLTRTWYMFLPLLSIVVALGIATLLNRFSISAGKVLAGIVALGITASPFFFKNHVQARQSPDNHPIYDARRIAKFLAPFVEAGVTVRMQNSLLPIVQYYLLREDVDIGGRVLLYDKTANLSGSFLLCPRDNNPCRQDAGVRTRTLVYEGPYTQVYRIR